MSGISGVPLTILGVFMSGHLLRMLLLATGLLAFSFATFLMWQDERLKRREAEEKLTENNFNYNALAIEFDPTNTLREFWSREQRCDDIEGKLVINVYKECRVKIWNNSRKTVSSVEVTSRPIGHIPQRPELMIFDSNKKSTLDIHPSCFALVPVARGPVKPIAGLACGPSAAEVYGPLEVIVTGRDVASVRRVFQFDWQLDPMIYD